MPDTRDLTVREAIREALATPAEQLRQIGAGNAAYVRKRFPWSAVMRRYLRVYEAIT